MDNKGIMDIIEITENAEIFLYNTCIKLEEVDIIDMLRHMSKDEISIIMELSLKGFLLFIHHEIYGFDIYAVKPFNKMEGMFEFSINNGFNSIDGELAINILSIQNTDIILNNENIKILLKLEREREYIYKKFIDVHYKNLEFVSSRLQFMYHMLSGDTMFYKFKKTNEEYCDENIQVMENIIPIKIYRDITSIEQVNIYSTVSLVITTKNPVIISYTILYGYDKMLTIYCVTEREFLLNEDLSGVLSISYNSINALINKLNKTNIHNNTCVILNTIVQYPIALISILTKICLRFLVFETVAYISDFVDLVLLQDNINRYNIQ